MSINMSFEARNTHFTVCRFNSNWIRIFFFVTGISGGEWNDSGAIEVALVECLF